MVKKLDPILKQHLGQSVRLDKRISDLEVQAKSVEERARYAEQEAQLRKRIADAQKKIADNTPPGMFSGVFPSLVGKMPKGGARVILVLAGIVVLIVIVFKACGNG